MVNCCVVKCNRSTNKDSGSVKLFRFPARNLEQRQLWIAAVKRKCVNGKVWQPSEFTRICSDHFEGGIASPTRNHPSYVPSIFPTKDVKPKKVTDVTRFERVAKRNQAAQNKFKMEQIKG